MAEPERDTKTNITAFKRKATNSSLTEYAIHKDQIDLDSITGNFIIHLVNNSESNQNVTSINCKNALNDQPTLQWLAEQIIKGEDEYELSLYSNGAKLAKQDCVYNAVSNLDTILIDIKATMKKEKKIYIDGESMTIEKIVQLSNLDTKIELCPEVKLKLDKARKILTDMIDEGKVVYGVNTGFGKLADKNIPNYQISKLQENLIFSHAVGVGPHLNVKSTRMLFALRINSLAKGYSGITYQLLSRMVEIFNTTCAPLVPEQGTVSASGDLAPLSHLVYGLMGHGEMWSEKTGWGESKQILKDNSVLPIVLGPKEGLSLINGTQFVTSLGAEAVYRADMLCKQADIIAALTIEALHGSNDPFCKQIHELRSHKGQGISALRLRATLHSDIHKSEIAEFHKNKTRVQDPYSLRCCPQVHGIVIDTIEFVKSLLEVEMNSATDNPVMIPSLNTFKSCGNFHGEYPGKALDYLAIAIHEISSISERRIEQLCNPSHSNLYAFLVNDTGLNSGYMMAHVTACSLVSENKVLCHPSTVDSISTSAGQEDHVSMGGMAARKVLKIIDNVENVLAIELLAACQALDLVKPKKTTLPLESVCRIVRSEIPTWDQDRYGSKDIILAAKMLRDGKIWKIASYYVDKYIQYENEMSATSSDYQAKRPHLSST